MARPAKPVQLLVMEGNTRHLTREEIEFREDNEIRIGDSHDFRRPRSLNENREAIKKWKEIISIYKDIDFVSVADTGAIERYCLLYSDWLALQASRAKIIAEDKLAGLSENISMMKLNKLNLDEKISRKLDLILKLEDRLFLNPLSKVRSIPKKTKEEKEQSELENMGFGG
jgi:phage terminase small subunit